MLKIVVPALESWDAVKNEFIYSKEYTLCLEHSLVSISKWESNWCKPFLTDKELTIDETIDYIKCMTLTQNVPDEVYSRLTTSNINDVKQYISAKRTASWVTHRGRQTGGGKQITSELIYYWMIQLNIPVEFQKWHLSRLLMLIDICNAEGQNSQKMSKQEIMAQNRALNAARRSKHHTKG